MESQKFLESYTIKQLIESDQTFELITAPSTSTVIDILQVLSKHNISAVPVVDEQGTIPGCVDVLDILSWAAFELEGAPPTQVNSKVKEFANHRVRDIVNFSKRNPWNDLSYKAKFSELLDLLSNTSAHRVAITNEQIDIVGLITQSRIIRFFFDHKDVFQDNLSKTVEQVWGSKSEKGVLSIHHNNFVIDALKLMRDHKVSGLPIIDEHGKLVGNISAGDLKHLDATVEGLREDLSAQIRSFKNITSTPSVQLPHFDPISVKKEDTLLKIVELCLSKKIHRVFVVDSEMKPTHVISLGDVIKALK